MNPAVCFTNLLDISQYNRFIIKLMITLRNLLNANRAYVDNLQLLMRSFSHRIHIGTF